MNSTAYIQPSPCEQAKANPEEAQSSCFLRPRFYAGQLLTEADLSRLDQYMVGKQRFYNRHFHDWGVVCGLVASCDTCNPQNVHVSAGYAIGPSGEDIVTIDETIDVCKLLHRDSEPENKCTHLESPKDKTDVYKHWLLSVHYKETPLHIPPEITPTTDCCNTACPPMPSAPNAISEQYEFKLTPYYTDKSHEKSTYGFGPNVEVCMKELRRIISLPVSGETNLERAKRLQTWKTSLEQSNTISRLTNCFLADQLETLSIPDVSNGGDPEELVEALNAAEDKIKRLHIEMLIECVCNAAHPTCQMFASDGVPLAVIAIYRDEYKVRNICNWSGRKTARTLPQLDYWFSSLAERLAEKAQLICYNRSGLLEIILNALKTVIKGKVVSPLSRIGGVNPATANGMHRAQQQDGFFAQKEKAFLADRLAEFTKQPSERRTFSDMLSPLLAIALNRTVLAEGILNQEANTDMQNKIQELTARLDELEQKTTSVRTKVAPAKSTRKRRPTNETQRKVRKSKKPMEPKE